MPEERTVVWRKRGCHELAGCLVVGQHVQPLAVAGDGATNNHIKITPSVRTGEVKEQIEQALIRSAETDARSIRVEAYDGKVTLRGTVHSWAEQREAGRAAWAAPGVHDVKNELVVGDIP